MIGYYYDAYVILNKIYSEGAYLKQAVLKTPIEEKNRKITVKIVYGVLDKDIELGYYIKKLCDKNPKLHIRTILKISMYLMEYMDKPPYTVIDNAVELTKKLGKKGASGFVNAVLRKFSTDKPKLPENKNENFSVKYSYPLFASKELINDYGEDVAAKIASYEDTGAYIRFSVDTGEEYLKERAYEYKKTPFDKLFYVKNFTMDEGFYKGIYTFQNIGSVSICDIVGGGDNLLDACAAPGGKSVLLSEKFDRVTSVDIHPHRVELISDYAKRMKRHNITAVCADSQKHNPDFTDKFDAVLCDVPCSGFGVAFESPDIKLNREESSIEELNKIQLSIIKTCSDYVKPGGFLYYSTCSIFNRENQVIIDEFMSDELLKEKFVAVDIDSKNPHLKTKSGLQFLPHLSGGGFFVAKLKRIK